MTTPAPTVMSRSLTGPVLGVIVLMLFGYAFGEDMIIAVFEAFGREYSTLPRILADVVDVVTLLVTGLLKLKIDRIDGGAPGLWGWWWTGAVAILLVDVVLYVTGAGTPVPLYYLMDLVQAVAMGLVLVSSLNADPLTLFSARRRVELPLDWQRVRAVVPLVIGTYVAFAGATLWWDHNSSDAVRELDPAAAAAAQNMPPAERLQFYAVACSGAVSSRFFDQMAFVIPTLLITLGLETGFFPRNRTDPVQLVATGVTFMVLSLGLVATLSTFLWNGTGCGQVLSKWHEYIAFVLTLQGVFMALAALVWGLVAPQAGAEPESPGERG